MIFLFFMLYFYPMPLLLFFFFNDTATTEIYTLSLHDALPIFLDQLALGGEGHDLGLVALDAGGVGHGAQGLERPRLDDGHPERTLADGHGGRPRVGGLSQDEPRERARGEDGEESREHPPGPLARGLGEPAQVVAGPGLAPQPRPRVAGRRGGVLAEPDPGLAGPAGRPFHGERAHGAAPGAASPGASANSLSTSRDPTTRLRSRRATL